MTDYQLVIASCYLPPEKSPWGRNADDFFAHLVKVIYSVSKDTYCFIVYGDFYVRVGSLEDYIQRDIDDIYTKLVSLLHNEINYIILLKKTKFKSGKEF